MTCDFLTPAFVQNYYRALKKSSVYRSLRKWWVALPANRQELFRQWAWQRRWHLAACVAIATVIVSLFLLTHLDETPVTGRTRLLVFSRESYIELAAITSAMVRDGRGKAVTCVSVCLFVHVTDGRGPL